MLTYCRCWSNGCFVVFVCVCVETPFGASLLHKLLLSPPRPPDQKEKPHNDARDAEGHGDDRGALVLDEAQRLIDGGNGEDSAGDDEEEAEEGVHGLEYWSTGDLKYGRTEALE